jgi:epoxide hydrolase-like predicted phosphatase
MVTKAIIFDCFGVLVTSARNALKNDYPGYEIQIDDLGHQSDYGLISRQQFNDSLAELIGMTAAEIDSKYWNASLRNESAIKWVRELKQSGKYKIGMLSNVGYGLLNSSFSVSEQTELFDEVVLSSDVGMAKPEAMIFELTIQRLGVKPSECIMIDDTAINVEVAENVGMQSILFISTNQAQTEFSRLLETDRA